jgi:ABC-type multidrug transport system ATPase subunit
MMCHAGAGRAGELAAEGSTRNAIEVYGLQKVFPHVPGAGCFFCCPSEADPRAFWAIKGSWLSIAENQLFCLLGPNGAGKSTTINCLTGGRAIDARTDA